MFHHLICCYQASIPMRALYEAALRLVRTSRPVPRDVWGKWTAWICLRGSFLAFTVDYDAAVRSRKMVNFAQETRIVGDKSLKIHPAGVLSEMACLQQSVNGRLNIGTTQAVRPSLVTPVHYSHAG
jgi:hypothetical protein